MKTIKIDNKPIIQNIKEVNRVIIDIYFPIQDNMTDAPKRNILINIRYISLMTFFINTSSKSIGFIKGTTIIIF